MLPLSQFSLAYGKIPSCLLSVMAVGNVDKNAVTVTWHQPVHVLLVCEILVWNTTCQLFQTTTVEVLLDVLGIVWLFLLKVNPMHCHMEIL